MASGLVNLSMKLYPEVTGEKARLAHLEKVNIMLHDTCRTRGWCGKNGSCAFGRKQPLTGQLWCWKGHFSCRSYKLSLQLAVWHAREMTHQMPAAVCFASGEHHGLRHYKRGMVPGSQITARGKHYAEVSSSLTDRCVRRKVPNMSLRQVMVVLWDTKLTAMVLCWCHIAVQGRRMWMHGTCPSDTAGHQAVPSSESSCRTSVVPPSTGAWVPGVPENQVCILCYPRRVVDFPFSKAASAWTLFQKHLPA